MAFGLILASIFAAGTVANVIQTKSAADDSKKAEERQQRQADIKAARERVKVAREARIKRAEISQSAEATGASGSSEVGALSSVTAQAAEQTTFLNQVQQLSGEASIFRQRAAGAQSRAATYGAAASLAGMGLKNQKQLESGFDSIFN